MGLLEGKVAVVTGAGHGIGRGEALELARQGAKVVVNDVGGSVHGEGTDKRPAEDVADVIKARGGEATANYDDVADWAGAANWYARPWTSSVASTFSSTTRASCVTPCSSPCRRRTSTRWCVST
jgi:NAD(P)-dependent dehydrogenase (short-subunit alcohol dehydrogenase family)